MTTPHPAFLRFGRANGMALLVACALVGCGTPWRTSPPPGTATTGQREVPAGIVSVTYADPAKFSEAVANPREGAKARQVWVDELCLHLSDRAAAALPTGQRLEVKITDVRRAGRFEPLRGPQGSDVRIVRDVYPPLIDLDFRLLAADGSVLRQGRRELRDIDFMARASRNGTDPLRYEKALADDWVAREFRSGT